MSTYSAQLPLHNGLVLVEYDHTPACGPLREPGTGIPLAPGDDESVEITDVIVLTDNQGVSVLDIVGDEDLKRLEADLLAKIRAERWRAA